MSEQLPWDLYGEPADVPPVPAQPPYSPTPVASPPRPPEARVDWDEILDDAWPAIKEQVIGYARDSARAVVSGQTVDLAHPTVTTTDVTGKELVIADAKSRSWRTLIQGLIFDVMAAIVAAVALLAGADPFQQETWVAFGILLLKSVVSAIISYFMRLKVTPTIKTEGEKFAVAPLPRPILTEEKRKQIP